MAMVTHSSTFAWQIPWMEEPGRLQSMGSLGVGHDWATHFHFSLLCTGEGNGNPLQCSCLENPRDGGAWWAATYGVAQSRTRLKWVSSIYILRPSLIAQLVKNLPAMQETLVQLLSQEDLLEKGQATHSSILGFPCGSAGKESTCNVGDLGSIPGLGKSLGEGKGSPLQYPGLENSMDCIFCGVSKSRIQLNDFHFTSLHIPSYVRFKSFTHFLIVICLYYWVLWVTYFTVFYQIYGLFSLSVTCPVNSMMVSGKE